MRSGQVPAGVPPPRFRGRSVPSHGTAFWPDSVAPCERFLPTVDSDSPSRSHLPTIRPDPPHVLPLRRPDRLGRALLAELRLRPDHRAARASAADDAGLVRASSAPRGRAAGSIDRRLADRAGDEQRQAGRLRLADHFLDLHPLQRAATIWCPVAAAKCDVGGLESASLAGDAELGAGGSTAAVVAATFGLAVPHDAFLSARLSRIRMSAWHASQLRLVTGQTHTAQ